MSTRFVLTRSAQADLEDTWDDVIRRFDLETAARVLDALESACRLLADHPEIGHLREDIAKPPVRFWPVGPSLICYDSSARPLRILRIARAERDWERLI